MNHLRILVLLFLLLHAPARAEEASVELNHRLQPNRDLIAESTTEAITTIRVVEDRGIVAKLADKGVRLPTTVHLIQRRAHRFTTGSPDPDGSFDAQIVQLTQSTAVKLPSGEERPLPERPGRSEHRVTAKIDASGKVRSGSVEISGVQLSSGAELSQQDTMHAGLAGIIEQAFSGEPIRLTKGQSTPQEVRMQMPILGMTTLDLTIKVANRLLDIENGIAKVEVIFTSVEFRVPAGPFRIEASGTGGGTILYELATKTVRSDDSSTMFSFLADTPDGVVDIRANSRRTRVTRDAPGSR